MKVWEETWVDTGDGAIRSPLGMPVAEFENDDSMIERAKLAAQAPAMARLLARCHNAMRWPGFEPERKAILELLRAAGVEEAK